MRAPYYSPTEHGSIVLPTSKTKAGQYRIHILKLKSNFKTDIQKYNLKI